MSWCVHSVVVVLFKRCHTTTHWGTPPQPSAPPLLVCSASIPFPSSGGRTPNARGHFRPEAPLWVCKWPRAYLLCAELSGEHVIARKGLPTGSQHRALMRSLTHMCFVQKSYCDLPVLLSTLCLGDECVRDRRSSQFLRPFVVCCSPLKCKPLHLRGDSASKVPLNSAARLGNTSVLGPAAD